MEALPFTLLIIHTGRFACKATDSYVMSMYRVWRRGQVDAAGDRVYMKGGEMRSASCIVSGHSPRGGRCARGVASVMAMLYLMLFSTLAVGFFATAAVNSQIPSNDKRSQWARMSAESGMGFMRYQLATINLPAGTTSANLLANVSSQLGSVLNGTTNMGTNSVTVSNGTIYIPSSTAWISLDSTNGCQFQVTITQSGNYLIVTTTGSVAGSSATRSIQQQFRTAPFSMIGLSSLTMSGSAFTDSYDASQGAYNAAKTDHRGAVCSNGNITLSNTAKVDGDASCGVGMTTTLNNSASITGINGVLPTTVSFPSVTLPAVYTDLGDVNMSSGTMSMPAGTYLIHNLTLSGTAHVIWSGKTTIYISTSYNVSGNVIIDTYQNLAGNRTLNFLPTCTSATWSGTNVCYGTLYGPDTNFTISGGVQLFGRVIGKSINNSSTGGMHTDESLPTPGGVGGCIPVRGTYIELL